MITLDHPLAWIVGLAFTGVLLAAGTFLVWHMVSAHARRAERRDRRDERDLGRPNAWLLPLLLPLLLAPAASAQLLTQGAAPYPSPSMGRTFLDQPVAQCVVAVPCPYNQDCVILKPCPPNILPTPTPPIATPPTGPPVATPPIATPPPSAAQLPAREPIVIQCPPMPTPTPQAAPVPAPKPAKKKCPSC